MATPQGTTPTPFVSLPVKTHTTPGAASAGLVLIERMRAAQYHCVVHPRHLDIFDISGRAGDEPRIFAAADALANKSFCLDRCGGHGRLLLTRARCGGLHRVHDVLVSRAAAHVAFQSVANLLLGRGRMPVDGF